jgi:hypothetical protein
MKATGTADMSHVVSSVCAITPFVASDCIEDQLLAKGHSSNIHRPQAMPDERNSTKTRAPTLQFEDAKGLENRITRAHKPHTIDYCGNGVRTPSP